MTCDTEEFLAVIGGFIVVAFLAWVLIVDPLLLDQAIQREKDNHAAYDSDGQANIPDGAAIEADPPPPPRKTYDTYQEKQHRLDLRRYRIEVLTLFAVIVYALLTFRTLRTSERSAYITHQALVFAQRARIVLGNSPKGNLIEFVEHGDNASISVFLRNAGHVSAHQVVVEMWGMVAPPIYTLTYPPFDPPGRFMMGPTISEDMPYVPSISIEPAQVTAIKNGKSFLRIVGRIRYWDDFDHYCEPFSILYINSGMNWYRGEPEVMPSIDSPFVCDRAGGHKETFAMDEKGIPAITFDGADEHSFDKQDDSQQQQ
jgi:hypothetical protein